jgi:hypothetical protein
LTDYKEAKSVTGEELCIFHWGIGFMRAMKKCPGRGPKAQNPP